MSRLGPRVKRVGRTFLACWIGNSYFGYSARVLAFGGRIAEADGSVLRLSPTYRYLAPPGEGGPYRVFLILGLFSCSGAVLKPEEAFERG